MCVILIGKVGQSLHKQALEQNGDGFSLYTEELGLVKSPTEEQVKAALNKFGIWHYRIATSGKLGDINVHPFPICGGEYLLYHNGVLGSGLGEKSDTHALADMLMDVDIKVATSVIESLSERNRFVIASAKDPKWFRVFGKWEAEAGVLLSHKLYYYPRYSRDSHVSEDLEIKPKDSKKWIKDEFTDGKNRSIKNRRCDLYEEC